jgi:phospholipid transport system substrate-binding protein
MVVMPCRAASILNARRSARMFARRAGAALAGAILVALVISASAPLRAAPLEPATVVGQFNDSLLAAMAQQGTPGYRSRYDILAAVVDKTFDISLMTRMAVGPGWVALPEDQQRRLTDAFRRFITSIFAARFDAFAGETFVIQGGRAMGSGTLVENQLVTPGGERIQINYLMHETPDGWRAVDVYLNGTISELAVHRSEFTAILKRSGAEGLIAALDRKTQYALAPG